MRGFIRAVSLRLASHCPAFIRATPSQRHEGMKAQAAAYFSCPAPFMIRRRAKATPFGNITDKFNAQLLDSGGAHFAPSVSLLSKWPRAGWLLFLSQAKTFNRHVWGRPAKKLYALATLVEDYWIRPSHGELGTCQVTHEIKQRPVVLNAIWYGQVFIQTLLFSRNDTLWIVKITGKGDLFYATKFPIIFIKIKNQFWSF